MTLCTRVAIYVLFLTTLVLSYPYDPVYEQYNLNQNKTATNALEYWGEWTGHEYTPSPTNWRFPFYTIFLDRFVNGDPRNDNINKTMFEHDINSNQMRHGGDLQGLVDTLDYIQGMGIKGLYLAGSPFINEPWGYDQYSPLDLSIMEPHFGTIDMWRTAINEIHARDMYVILDNTFATLGDLIGFDGYLNTTAPFTLKEHHVQWKSDRHYWDFHYGNTYNETCDYPPFWNETGFPIDKYIRDKMVGCYASEFDQYGDTEAFGVFPDWRRELSKFASVQDRLREWHPPVRAKLERFYCMAIAQLDVDGFRYDKATQSTVDAMGYMNDAVRTCARRFGKDNFFTPGEITGGNDFGSIFLGRGRQPNMLPENITQAVTLQKNSSMQYFLRDPQYGALDAAAFHYTVYRTLTRFLGMDGNLAAGYDAPLNWIDQWNTYLITNDFINANTGEFDPRHMYGVTNQDVFRWPGIEAGIHRQLLGHFITIMHMPGLPLLLWGEEQAFYILDSQADNYIFGRQAMSTATAWQTHGCYSLGSDQYYDMPFESCRHGCTDDTVSYDHRDPSAPVRNILKHMFNLRQKFPVLNDGFFLQQLSNHTWNILYPGSSGVPTETGMWSVLRSGIPGVQDFGNEGFVWLVYSNYNKTKTYEFNCHDKNPTLNTTALIAPFPGGTTVKNLLYPFDELTLENSTQTLYINNDTSPNGCLKSLDMVPYDFRAYVPIQYWIGPTPMITKFYPGHDARILSSVNPTELEDIEVEIQFSVPMECASVTHSIVLNSTTELDVRPEIDLASIKCGEVWRSENVSMVSAVQSSWAWKATLKKVANGVHSLTVRNATAADGLSTDSIDRFLFRVGQHNNPMVFTRHANYSETLLTQLYDGTLVLNHSAPGADLFRYSTNFMSSFSDWMPYEGGMHTIEKQPWSGTSLQSWKGEHLRVEYYSRFGGSSDHVQESDLGSKRRRFPHMWLNGPYNYYGYDAGLNNEVTLVDDYTWEHHWMVEWSNNGSIAQLNVWGINPDGLPDQTYVMGDADGDSVLDRLPPSALAPVVLNVTQPPPKPYLSWRFVIDDGNLRFQIIPEGSMWTQLVLYILLATIPIITATLSVWIFKRGFYKVKFNEIGIQHKESLIPAAFKRPFPCMSKFDELEDDPRVGVNVVPPKNAPKSEVHHCSSCLQKYDALQISSAQRRTVLIATMEYDIEDWNIKVKIGGLGVMAQLMGKNLGHQDLIWVIPCVGGIEYPTDEIAEPMLVQILGSEYNVNVQIHRLRNITYVLLDAPVFRQQTKAEPYPARMDDMTSAIYYSAWNQCIAQALTRFPVDLYHINDYHGTVAPLYLLPRTFPVCLSLHNAEFQGLWPMRTKQEREEVCSVFNLPENVVQEYVQFGEIFNLLHAGASLLRIQQEGFGAVGVSKKYGKRAYSRYPIFWGLQSVQGLPNPDPTDTGEWDKKLPKEAEMKVDPAFEKERLDLRVQAQKWAGLEENPTAELFVFVGRWSNQKGVDLIADVFPAVLESNKNVQLICVGPVIDLYGKFAALKLERLMKLYPKRVYSKPEFTALPPYIFSGAEFALIPSRDEPFGLVAVEFGRKGALGVGARVGGLGQMPGWWFTVESMTTDHLLHQFKEAIHEALSSPAAARAKMRARSAKQRFPVAQWVEDLEILQSTSIRIYNKVKTERRPDSSTETLADTQPYALTDAEDSDLPAMGAKERDSKDGNQSSSSSHNEPQQVGGQMTPSSDKSRPKSLNFSRLHEPIVYKEATFGTRHGPGHIVREDYNDGIAKSGLSEGKSFLEPISRSKRPSIGRAVSTTLTRNPWRIGSADSDSESDSETSGLGGDDSDVEDDSLLESTQIEQCKYAIPSVHRPQLIDRDSWDIADNDLAQWPLSLQRLPSLTKHNSNERPRTRKGSRDSPESNEITALPPVPPIPMDDENDRPRKSRSMVSVDTVVGERTDFNLQKVDPFFTDSNGYFYEIFRKKLETLDKNNSETTNCIEEFLEKSEKLWFNNFRNAKLGRQTKDFSSRPSSIAPKSRPISLAPSSIPTNFVDKEATEDDSASESDEFLLGDNYKPPKGLLKWMQIRFLSWPVYAYFMALGQIIAANSYQITLLTGEIGQTAPKLYVIACIYLVSSICWWMLYRRFAAVLSLSLPFFFYGLAFLLVGVASFASGEVAFWIQNVGTGFYAIASSSGALFFALNFGDEGGAHVKAWVFRACMIQGTQQIYVVALWYWGSVLTKRSVEGIVTASNTIAGTWITAVITLPIAMLLWLVGLIMLFGLPRYYRQTPGKMPSFYRSILRRNVVLWFFFTAVIQNFFLSAPYGRNWSFLFSSQHAKTWQVLCLVFFFFIFVWAGALAVFGRLSKSHSWMLPIFAVGLLAPRWAQIWWGTSNVGLYLPWAGGFVASALVSRALWLWLGVLDAIQGVGLGMIMLGTLTRVHVAFAVMGTQVLGSMATIVARAAAPNRIGPGPISPDITGSVKTIWQAWFWIGLSCNLLLCIGFYKFYRKEQLLKP